MEKELEESLVRHLQAKLRTADKERFVLYHDMRDAQRKADMYEKLWCGIKSEVCNTFAQHSLNPQLLYSYMVGQEAITKAEQEE